MRIAACKRRAAGISLLSRISEGEGVQVQQQLTPESISGRGPVLCSRMSRAVSGCELSAELPKMQKLSHTAWMMSRLGRRSI